MKKFFVIAVLGLTTLAISACGSGKAHCDAYGDNHINIEEESDLAENS